MDAAPKTRFAKPRFYPNQMDAARNIITAYKAGISYSLLIAPMQSGKSGTFHCVARLMLEEGLVDTVYILSGCAETVLKFQAEQDAIKYNNKYVISGAMSIHFHGDMMSMLRKNKYISTERTLWIVDESHMVQGRGQKVDQFYKHHGVGAYGTTDDMIINEMYFLSVSATPYSELSAIHYNESKLKHVEELVPGPNYFGVENYWYGNYIKETFDIMAEKDRFLDILRAKGNAYNLIRLTNRKGTSDDNTYTAFVKKICTEAGFRVVFCTSDSSEVQIAVTREEQVKYETEYCMEDVPDVPTVVILKGRLRAGKVVPKEHIGIVWENSKEPNVDTIFQSLVGRMCGYIADQPNKPDIYLPRQFMEETETIIKASPVGRFILGGKEFVPSKATNMRSSRMPSVEECNTFPTVPIKIDREVMRARVSSWDDIIPKTQHDPNMGAYLEAIRDYLTQPEMRDYFQNSTHYLDAQKEEIHAWLDSGSAPLFRGVYSDNDQGKLLKDVKKNAERGECPITILSNCKKSKSAFFTVVTPTVSWKTAEGGCADDFGHVWLYISLKHKNFPQQISLEARIAKSNDKHIFKVMADDETAGNLYAGGVMGLKKTIRHNPIAFKKQLSKYVYWWRMSKTDDSYPAIGSILTPINSATFSLYKPAYTDEILGKIVATINERFGVKLTIDTEEGPADRFSISKIHWV